MRLKAADYFVQQMYFFENQQKYSVLERKSPLTDASEFETISYPFLYLTGKTSVG